MLARGRVAGGPPSEAGAPLPCVLSEVLAERGRPAAGERAPSVFPKAFAEQGRPIEYPAGEEAPSADPRVFAEQGRPFPLPCLAWRPLSRRRSHRS